MAILKWIGIVLLFCASVVGGSIAGSVIGAIYGPIKIMQMIEGDGGQEPTSYIDDEI